MALQFRPVDGTTIPLTRPEWVEVTVDSTVYIHTLAMMVPGGWLVRVDDMAAGTTGTPVFVPDPSHLWRLAINGGTS